MVVLHHFVVFCREFAIVKVAFVRKFILIGLALFVEQDALFVGGGLVVVGKVLLKFLEDALQLPLVF